MLTRDPAEQLAELCRGPDRRPGSPANDRAVDMVAGSLRELGWRVTTPAFDVVAWDAAGGRLGCGVADVELAPSPYGLGVDAGGVLVGVPDVDMLAELVGSGRADGTVLLLHGDLVREPLTPASFPFYAVPEHDRIRELLAGSGAVAVVSATGRSPQTAGAVEPFPFVEDGEFPVPAADVHVRELPRLLAWTGRSVRIAIDAHRRPARARNVEARLGRDGRRVVVTAHVDSKPGTPGALDNAAGVVAALQLAALLSGQLAAGRGEPPAVEIVVVNGEDYFSAAGEVDWLRRNGGLDAPLTDVSLAVNIDAAGFRRDDVAWSGYNLDVQPAERVRSLLARPGLTEGEQWWQSDHAVFAMRGRPALAFTSNSMTELLATLVHTPGDTPAVVDPGSLALTASAIADVISAIG